MFDTVLKALGLKKEDMRIFAPCTGTAVALAQVSDPVFGDKILGDGIAIVPTEGKIFSPVNGKIETMFATGHAVSINADFGAEVLVHVGLDTVSLKGQHYTVHKKTGDTVKMGELLITFDIAAIKAAGYDVITPVIVCNSDAYTMASTPAPVTAGDTLLTLAPKG